MNEKAFTKHAPGRLVPAEAYERRLGRDGQHEQAAVRGVAFVPAPLPPRGLQREAFIGAMYDELGAAERAVARLDAAISAIPNPRLIERPFRLREAQVSSRIENTIASLEEVALAEATDRSTRNEVLETLNHDRALEHGLTSPLPLCVRLFNDMHRILLDGVRGDDKRPGAIREVQNYISGRSDRFADARFVPPPPGEVAGLLRDLEVFLNKGGPREGPRFPRLIEVAMGHYQFETIHPYRDGNGRLGRLIVALALCKDGSMTRPLVYVSAYFEKHRQMYYDLLLAVSTKGDWPGWVRFFCTAVATQAADGLKRVKQLAGLREKYLRAITGPRASSLGPRLVDCLFERPALKITDAARALQVTYVAAQRHVLRLVEAGALQEVTGGNWGRVYVAREILDVAEAVDAE